MSADATFNRALTSRTIHMERSITRGDQINWNQVFYFSEIAAAGSIKIAAEKLDLSPSTLSEHLSQLESSLNVRLFQRQHRKIILTPEGARLFQYARQMFETGKRFIDVISPTALGGYPVTIGVVPSPSYSFAHRLIADYIRRHRDASVHVLSYQQEALEAALLESKLSFGFTDRRSDRKGIVQCPAFSSELGFFVSSELAGRELQDLLTELPLLICRSERRMPSGVEEILGALDLTPANIVVSEYAVLVENLCREGAGVALLGRMHFRNDPTVRMLQLSPNFPRMSEKLYATWLHDGENTEAVQRLKAFLTDI
jgi:DNA-binding transcriptional LysR family regulator